MSPLRCRLNIIHHSSVLLISAKDQINSSNSLSYVFRSTDNYKLLYL